MSPTGGVTGVPFPRFPNTPHHTGGVGASATLPTSPRQTSLVEYTNATTNSYATSSSHDPQYFGRPRTNEVTVFGFPKDKASRVINHFATFGEIVRRGDGNTIITHPSPSSII
jgi:hypothetical protein